MLDHAFEALKTFDWGTDRNALKPIDEAVVATQGDAATREELESQLAAVLKTDVSRDAKDFVCRKLTIIGTAASVPALAELLADAELSHMARYALERIDAPEAAKAMRDALPKIDNALKIGVMGSLGAREDTDSIAALAELLGDADPAVARSAAIALGRMRTVEAAKVLAAAKPEDTGVKLAAADATLACAEGVLAAGNKVQALSIYKGLLTTAPAKHVRLAVTRGMLACAGS